MASSLASSARCFRVRVSRIGHALAWIAPVACGAFLLLVSLNAPAAEDAACDSPEDAAVLTASPLVQALDQDLEEEHEQGNLAQVSRQWERDPAIEANLSELTSERRFRYCHEDGYRLWPHEKSMYCEQAQELASRCPELPRACERPAWGAQEVDWEIDTDWLSALGLLMRLLFWMLLALGVILLVRALVRSLADEVRRRRERRESTIEPIALTQDEPELPRETDVDRLLARARAEAERGDYASALGSAYAAALQALQQRELLKLHRSRTNGEYVRQLGAHPQERERMRQIVREVETVQFGQGQPDRDRFERVLREVSALVQRTAAWFLLIFLPLTLTSCDEAPSPDGVNSPNGPDGYALLESLLQRHSGSVQRRVRRLTDSLDDVTTFVALSPNLSEDEWHYLMAWVDEGGTLVTGGISPALRKHLERDPSSRRCDEDLTAPGLSVTQAGSHTFENFSNASPLVSCGQNPFLVGMAYGSGSVYALADTNWLRNANLAAADNSQIVVQLASAPYGRVELLGPWTGSGTQHPFASIHNAGLTPFLLQLLLLALAYAIARGVRFRSPVEPVREQRRAFAEHAEALANQYARSRASGYALEQYGHWALERIRERVPLRERDLHALAHAVARRTGGDPMAILRVLVEAQSSSQIQGAPEEHLKTMEALSRILRDVGGP